MPSLVEIRRVLFRSEEHTSELQSLTNLVCRLLLVKKYSRSRLIQFIRANQNRNLATQTGSTGNQTIVVFLQILPINSCLIIFFKQKGDPGNLHSFLTRRFSD